MHLMYPQLVSTHILMFHRTLRIDEKDIKRMKKFTLFKVLKQNLLYHVNVIVIVYLIAIVIVMLSTQ